jgi:hypothetical protein
MRFYPQTTRPLCIEKHSQTKSMSPRRKNENSEKLYYNKYYFLTKKKHDAHLSMNKENNVITCFHFLY